MAEDAELTATAATSPTPACPWCSAPLPGVEAATCPSCGARLVEEEGGVEIPGVTAVDPGLLAAATAPRKVRRTFGSLLVGDDDEIPPPSEAEMPALAPPDLEVRREMLRLELEARLTELRAEALALEADDRAEALSTAEGSAEAVVAEAVAEAAPEPATEAAGAAAAEVAPEPAADVGSEPPAPDATAAADPRPGAQGEG